MLKLLLAVALLVIVHSQEDANVDFDVSSDTADTAVADDSAAVDTSDADVEGANEDDADEEEADETEDEEKAEDEEEAEDTDDDEEEAEEADDDVELVVIIDPPSVSDQMAAQVVLPEMGEGLQSPDVSKCLDEEKYKQSDLIETENDMLCAFIAFQANKDMSEPGNKVYANREEATMRYGLFKECVNNVKEINSDKQRSWRAGVNLFCDMTASERYPYFNGVIHPQNAGDNAAEDGDRVKKSGMLLGAARN